MNQKRPDPIDFRSSGELEPLRATSLADMVERRICLYIRDKGLRPGDPLPKEFEFAERLQVSRNVVREALGRLRLIGLIESRKRRGMIVANPDILSGLERVLHAAALSEDTVRELFELRLVVEVGMADLLFIRRSDYYLKMLSEVVAREALRPGDRKWSRDCDIAFHSILYRMAGNRLLERFQSILTPYFDQIAPQMPPQQPDEAGYKSHRELLAILKNGTPEKFRSGMRGHLKQLTDFFCPPAARGAKHA